MEREETPAERGEGARDGDEVVEVAGGWDWMRGLEKDCWVRVGGGGSCESSLRRVASKEDCLSLLEVDLVMALVPEIAGEVLPDDEEEEGTGWGRDEDEAAGTIGEDEDVTGSTEAEADDEDEEDMGKGDLGREANFLEPKVEPSPARPRRVRPMMVLIFSYWYWASSSSTSEPLS